MASRTSSPPRASRKPSSGRSRIRSGRSLGLAADPDGPTRQKFRQERERTESNRFGAVLTAYEASERRYGAGSLRYGNLGLAPGGRYSSTQRKGERRRVISK